MFIVGSDFTTGGLSPWNVVDGTAQSLTAPGTVAIDRTYYDRLGVSGVGRNYGRFAVKPVKVGAVTDGIRSFTMTPYVFTNLADARSYIGLPHAFTSHFLVPAEAKRGRSSAFVKIFLAKFPTSRRSRPTSFGIKVDRSGFSEQEPARRLFAGALLSVIVGTAIVAQTLYSSTKDHLYEFATLRAIGASNAISTRSSFRQALLNAVIGFSMAALIGPAQSSVSPPRARCRS